MKSRKRSRTRTHSCRTIECVDIVFSKNVLNKVHKSIVIVIVVVVIDVLVVEAVVVVNELYYEVSSNSTKRTTKATWKKEAGKI